MVLFNKNLAILASTSKSADEVLFPVQKPLTAEFLTTEDGHHRLWVESYGDPNGKPVVVLHGGPGAGVFSEYRHFPAGYHVIMYDQRGSRRSNPDCGLEYNTLDHLCEDTKMIIRHFGYESAMISGGSWGSNHAIAFAKKYPEMVDEIILRATWLACTETGYEIFDGNGPHKKFDESYAHFVALSGLNPADFDTQADFQHALALFYFNEVSCGDFERECEAAYRFMAMDTYEGCPNVEDAEPVIEQMKKDPAAERSITRQFFAYCLRGFDQSKEEILSGLEVLKDIPITSVTGLADFICPSYQAFELKEACPHIELFAVEGEGHGAFQPGIASVIRAASEKYLAAWKAS